MKSASDLKAGHREEQMENNPRHCANHYAGASGVKILQDHVKVDHDCVIDTLYPHPSRHDESPQDSRQGVRFPLIRTRLDPPTQAQEGAANWIYPSAAAGDRDHGGLNEWRPW